MATQRKKLEARPRQIPSAQTRARAASRAAADASTPKEVLQVVDSAHRDLSVLINAQRERRAGVGEVELHVEPRTNSKSGGIRIKLEAGRGCLVAEDRRDWTFEASDTVKVFYTQLDSAVEEGVYEAEAWLDSLPTSSAELRQEFKTLETPTAPSPHGQDTVDPPLPGVEYASTEEMFAANLSGLAHCYRSILVECFRHGHELGRIVSKAWAGSLALLEKSIRHGRDADSALQTKDEQLRAEQCDKEALAAAQAEVARLTLEVAEQKKIIDAADSVRQSELQVLLKREALLKVEVAQLGERTMVAENKLVRRDLEVKEREHNRKRGATVRGLSKAVVEVDDFLKEV